MHLKSSLLLLISGFSFLRNTTLSMLCKIISAASLFVTAQSWANTNYDVFGNEYIFQRDFEHTQDTEPNLDESYEVLKILTAQALPGIDFGWDRQPVLSSYYENLSLDRTMALDFAARCLTNCAKLNDNQVSQCIKNFASYYRMQTPTFVAREHAFNNVTFPHARRVDSETIQLKKLQSMANYNGLILHPISNCLTMRDLKRKKADFIKMIEDLPIATYLIQVIDPESYDTKEYCHLMVLIKRKEYSIFYESNDGAAKIKNGDKNAIIKLGEFVRDFVIELFFLEFRLYRIESGHQGCTNLSTEVVSY